MFFRPQWLLTQLLKSWLGHNRTEVHFALQLLDSKGLKVTSHHCLDCQMAESQKDEWEAKNNQQPSNFNKEILKFVRSYMLTSLIYNLVAIQAGFLTSCWVIIKRA